MRSMLSQGFGLRAHFTRTPLADHASRLDFPHMTLGDTSAMADLTKTHRPRWRASALFLVAVLLSGCAALSDTVTNSYATLADARADGLFDRGWLPDVLPESAVDIHTSNNLDLNFSVGDFSFSPTDSHRLFAHLSAGVPVNSPFNSWAQTVTDYKDDGYSAWSYAEGDSRWAFFCQDRKGNCDYYSWLNR